MLAEKVWGERLQQGILLPNGETVRVSLEDLYHAIVDSRIGRKPERIEQLLRGVFQIRPATNGRRKVLSRWEEESRELYGMAIIGQDSTLRSIHVVDEKRLNRETRKADLLWKL